ncbi:MAG: DUF5663 domain-containing protein [Aeromicrobium sp.]|uniref:DUF5663 domain-containing protein n=1 Tax=Aeromicrobium sp. TaxID=1871063 RepID=UPI0039E6DC6B
MSMIRIDHALLVEIGLGELPEELRQDIYSTIELRVGERLSAGMTDAQMAEFEKIIDSGDDAGATAWLTANAPDYRQIVATTFDELKAEIASQAEEILRGVDEA